MTDGSGPPASVLKRVTFFLVIGAVLFLLFDRFGPFQSGRGYRPRPVETVSAAGTVLDRTFDGHYYVSGAINGHEVAFMVDTGASTIAIGRELASRLDLGPCRPRRYVTAAGTVEGCEARAKTVEVAGLRVPDVAVAVLPGADTILLGMSVLRHFRIEQHGGRMTLVPPGRDAGRLQ